MDNYGAESDKTNTDLYCLQFCAQYGLNQKIFEMRIRTYKEKERTIMYKWKNALAAGIIGAMCICGCSSGQGADTESKKDYTTGTPWLTSVIEGNVTEDTPTNLKDDFYLAINKEDLLDLEIPAGHSSAGFLAQGQQKAEADITAMFTEGKPESHDEKLAYDFYNLLMDWDTRNEIGVTPLVESLEEIEKIDSLEKMTDYLVESPLDNSEVCLWNFGITVDFLDSSQRVAVIDTPNLLMQDSAEYETMTDLGKLRKEAKSTLIEKVLVKSGYSEDEAKAKVENALKFEALLSKGILTKKEQDSPDYYSKVAIHYTHDDIKKAAGDAPVYDYLIKKIGVSEDQEYLFASPDYLKTLAEIYTEENLDLMKDYLIVHRTMNMAYYLDRECYEWYWECHNSITGATAIKDDETVAADTVSSILPWPTGRLYTATYLSEEDKVRIKEFVEDLLKEYRDVLNNADFLSDEAKAAAIEKLDAISLQILYPDDWTPYTCEDMDFKSTEDGGTLLEALDVINEYNSKKNLEKLGKPVDKTEWEYPPTFFNCFYNPQSNKIAIFGAFTNGGFYRSDMTDEEMSAYIGFVAGHEITHAFDASGSQFDKDGNLHDWWSEEDREAFNKKNQKLIDYYNAIIPWDGAHYSGQVVCGEACADMGSIRCMLNLAAKKENFDYDTFFRGIANVWLEKDSKERAMDMLTDAHPLANLRVNCTLQQYQEFLDFYDIKEGDNMYLAPEDRVAIW